MPKHFLIIYANFLDKWFQIVPKIGKIDYDFNYMRAKDLIATYQITKKR